MILLAYSEVPDHTAGMHSLIWVFTIRICQRTRLSMAWQLYIVCKQHFQAHLVFVLQVLVFTAHTYT